MHRTIVPFTAEHLDAAAELLTARHRADRCHDPRLPERFEDPNVAREAIQAALAERGASGAAALHEGSLTGYLIGAPLLAAPGSIAARYVRPRSVWIDQAGHAVEASDGYETYRELYAVLAPIWLAAGCFTHYAELPAQDRQALAAWYSLGFGQEETRALRSVDAGAKNQFKLETASTVGTRTERATVPDRELRTENREPGTENRELRTRNRDPVAFEIRRAGPDDLAAVLHLEEGLYRYHAAPPISLPYLPEALDGVRREHQQAIVNPAHAYWLALQDGRAVGLQVFVPASDSPMITPERCIHLDDAYVEQGGRSAGVGSALLDRGLAWAREQGFDFCTVSWRTQNLSGGRFWPRNGFQPVRYQLSRSIDERIAWADGRQ
ncbi:MAG: GNAT family N-acetyltransferase [Dehalococcoidia bacterium]